MFEWNNKKKLKTLKAYGSGNTLWFEAGHEKAEVHLNNRNITKVVYSFKNDSTVVTKKDCHHVVVGKGNARRDVYHYLLPRDFAPTMRLGITKHKGYGTWSSLPHDFELRTEPGFEEVFFYLIRGGSIRAIQLGKGVWFDNSPVDNAWIVHDRSFSTIPMGYHPVVAEPRVHLSYVWIYLAKKKSWEKI